MILSDGYCHRSLLALSFSLLPLSSFYVFFVLSHALFVFWHGDFLSLFDSILRSNTDNTESHHHERSTHTRMSAIARMVYVSIDICAIAHTLCVCVMLLPFFYDVCVGV